MISWPLIEESNHQGDGVKAVINQLMVLLKQISIDCDHSPSISLRALLKRILLSVRRRNIIRSPQACGAGHPFLAPRHSKRMPSATACICMRTNKNSGVYSFKDSKGSKIDASLLYFKNVSTSMLYFLTFSLSFSHFWRSFADLRDHFRSQISFFNFRFSFLFSLLGKEKGGRDNVKERGPKPRKETRRQILPPDFLF